MTTNASTKGERTRARIVATAAPLFNQRGYVGASMTDLMAATGLEKGGIYRHFGSKDELALAAFDYASGKHRERILSYIDAHTSAVGRLTALGEAIASIVERPAVKGGCPLLNTAVESDDARGPSYAELRKRARAGMKRLVGYARTIIEQGIECGELRPTVDAPLEAEMMIATMEGALMLSKLFDDPRYVLQAATHFGQHASRMARASTD
jgi:TetR/AcrR family transcriptional regulator, transcriptional repressor for nem operon